MLFLFVFKMRLNQVWEYILVIFLIKKPDLTAIEPRFHSYTWSTIGFNAASNSLSVQYCLGCSVLLGDTMSTVAGVHCRGRISCERIPEVPIHIIPPQYWISSKILIVSFHSSYWCDLFKVMNILHITDGIPHTTGGIYPKYWTSSTALMISPHSTEHPPQYIWYPPQYLISSTVLTVCLQSTKHPPQ